MQVRRDDLKEQRQAEILRVIAELKRRGTPLAHRMARAAEEQLSAAPYEAQQEAIGNADG